MPVGTSLVFLILVIIQVLNIWNPMSLKRTSSACIR
jgi:hypothetical protein